MRLLWHSHSPAAPTGYGTPTALWLPALRDMGHEVTCSAFHGQTERTTSYQGIPVVNTDDGRYGATRLAELAKATKPDIIVTLMDIWALPPGVTDSLRIPAVNWIPVDTDPLSTLDEQYFRRNRGFPVAMSEHGGRMLAAAGLDGAAIPYAYDPAVFHPDAADRVRARRDAGLDGKFAVGINATPVERKAWPEQLEAYARLWREHPGDVILLARTSPSVQGIARDLGLPPEAIRWTAPGDTGQAGLASWYRTLDVLSACTYAEGFCLPVLEAQACGTPAIVTDAPPVSTETGLPGRHVACEPLWNPMHQAWWHRPSVTALHEALEAAYAAPASERAAASTAAAAHARKYAISAVAPWWAALLEERAAAGTFNFQLR